MKLLFDFLPIILFFGTFKYAESHKEWAAEFATRHFGTIVSGGTVAAAQAPVLLATVVVIVATLAQVLLLKARGRKVDAMLWVSLVSAVVGMIQVKPDHVFSRTILSIPHAFNPEHTVYGQGQGTRRYLWTESPRVLVDAHRRPQPPYELGPTAARAGATPG